MPAVALMGPRQVGKTTLAMEVARTRPSVYLDLEDRTDLQKVESIKEFHQNVSAAGYSAIRAAYSL